MQLEPKVARVAVEGFFEIMGLWAVNNEAARTLLGAPSESTFFAWRRAGGPRLSVHTARRIGYATGTYKALQILYSDLELADSWIKRPNRYFVERKPLDPMRGGERVRPVKPRVVGTPSKSDIPSSLAAARRWTATSLTTGG